MLIILAIVVALCVLLLSAYVLGGISADFAVEKGYDWDQTFNLCFFLGLFGCGFFGPVLVKSRPDLRLRDQVAKLETALNEQD